MNRFSLFMLFVISLASCVSNNEEDLYPCQPEHVKYSTDILPILEINCYECHDYVNVGVSQILLEGYDNLAVKIMDGQLLQAIRHEAGVTPMPFGKEKLDDCSIRTIETWINEGFPNN